MYMDFSFLYYSDDSGVASCHSGIAWCTDFGGVHLLRVPVHVVYYIFTFSSFLILFFQ